MENQPDIDHYLRIWNLSGATPIASTATSWIFTVCRSDSKLSDAVLKIFTPAGMRDEQHASVALKAFAGNGAALLHRHDSGAQLLERLEGPDLKSLCFSGADEEATKIIAGVIAKLHQAASPPDTFLPDLRSRFSALFDRRHDFPEAAALAGQLLATSREERILHGDIHHQNVMRSDGGWKAIDPKGIYGERTFDAANTLCNPCDMPQLVTDPDRFMRTAQILARSLDLDLRRLIDFVFVYACLSACWSLEDGDDPTLALQVSVIAKTANVASQ